MNRRGFLISITATGVAVSTLQRPAEAVTLPVTTPAAWGSQFSGEPRVCRECALWDGRLFTVAWRCGQIRIDLVNSDVEGGVVLHAGFETHLTGLDFDIGHAQQILARHIEPDLVEEIQRELEFYKHQQQTH